MSETPILTVEQGELQGRIATSPNGKTFFSFQGIPYAKPPIGPLRFKVMKVFEIIVSELSILRPAQDQNN